jgi:hypothetical protein
MSRIKDYYHDIIEKEMRKGEDSKEYKEATKRLKNKLKQKNKIEREALVSALVCMKMFRINTQIEKISSKDIDNQIIIIDKMIKERWD